MSYAARTGQIMKSDETVINEADIIEAKISGWIEKASGDNAVITATKAAVVSKSHYISAILAGYTKEATGLLTIKDGTTIKAEYPVYNSDIIVLPVPIKCTAGNAVSVTLTASGASGNIGKLNLVGFTF